MDRPALVLLVDGSPECRDVYSSVLAWAGYQVLEAETGEEGLRLAREHQPDLIITEFPLAIPGWSSLTEAIRADPALSGVCVLTVTSRAVPAYRERALYVGVDGFFVKPLTPRHLLQMVEDFVCTRNVAA